ncbi:MAG: hypothetical protein NXI31_13375 [bacterium]|nr:hypothetical protein [bacterium]
MAPCPEDISNTSTSPTLLLRDRIASAEFWETTTTDAQAATRYADRMSLLGDLLNALKMFLDGAESYSSKTRNDRILVANLVDRVADLAKDIGLSENDYSRDWRHAEALLGLCGELESYNDSETRQLLRSKVGSRARHINNMIRSALNEKQVLRSFLQVEQREREAASRKLFELHGKMRAVAMKLRTDS